MLQQQQPAGSSSASLFTLCLCLLAFVSICTTLNSKRRVVSGSATTSHIMWWTVHLSGGPRRVNHAAVPVGNKIFSFGGYCTGDDYKDNRIPIDVFVLNTNTYRWRKIVTSEDDKAEEDKNVPYQRYGHTVVLGPDQNNVYLFGGRNDESPCNVLYCFNTRKRKRSLITADLGLTNNLFFLLLKARSSGVGQR